MIAFDYLTPLANELRDKGLGTHGVDLFVDRAPEDVDKWVLLTDRLTGTEPVMERGAYYVTRTNIIVRDTTRDSGIQKCHDCANALASYQEWGRDGVLFKQVTIMHVPRTFPTSAGDYLEFLARLEVRVMEV